MKRFSRFSFGRLLRNDRLMMVSSLLLAIVMWYFVISGSANITTRTITCTLNTANVSNGSLQVIEEQTITVDVVVEGAWSDSLGLTAEDIRVQLNAADIRAAGKCRINVVASRNSQKGGYNILSTSPSVATLFCDEWVEEKVFSVSSGGVIAEAAGITAADGLQKNTPILDDTALPGGVLVVQGPRTEVDNIARLVAMVDETDVLSEKRVYTGDIVAQKQVVENGETVYKPMDIVYSRFWRYNNDPNGNQPATLLEVSTLDVLVTLNKLGELTFTSDAQNKPEGLDLSSFVTISPASVEIFGEQALVDECLQTLATLDAIDFDRVSLANQQIVQTVVLPAGVTVIGNQDYVSQNENGETVLTVTRRFNWSGYSDKTIVWQVNAADVTIENVPAGHEAVPQTRLYVKVIGKASAIRNLTVSDLTATIVLENGVDVYSIRPVVDNPDVWVYYPDDGANNYLVKVTIAPIAATADAGGVV